MSNVDETRKIIESMRAKRSALGDNTDTSRRIHYKRMTRSKAADGVLFVYIFIAGMLFSGVMSGSILALLVFVLVIVVAIYTYLRE